MCSLSVLMYVFHALLYIYTCFYNHVIAELLLNFCRSASHHGQQCHQQHRKRSMYVLSIIIISYTLHNQMLVGYILGSNSVLRKKAVFKKTIMLRTCIVYPKFLITCIVADYYFSMASQLPYL